MHKSILKLTVDLQSMIWRYVFDDILGEMRLKFDFYRTEIISDENEWIYVDVLRSRLLKGYIYRPQTRFGCIVIDRDEVKPELYSFVTSPYYKTKIIREPCIVLSLPEFKDTPYGSGIFD